MPRLEWLTILEGAKSVSIYLYSTIYLLNLNNIFFRQIGYIDTLPQEIPQTCTEDTEFLQKLHHILLEVDITNGYLECPETGRQFPICNGIPNMLLNEDEV